MRPVTLNVNEIADGITMLLHAMLKKCENPEVPVEVVMNGCGLFLDEMLMSVPPAQRIILIDKFTRKLNDRVHARVGAIIKPPTH